MKRIWISYVKKNKKSVLLYAVFLGTVYLVLWLYGVRRDALDYMAFVSLIIFLMTGIADMAGYYRRIRQIREGLGNLPCELKELPKPRELSERCYQEAIGKLYGEVSARETKMRIGRQEMQDFYGMWAHQIKTPIAAMNLLLESTQEMAERLKEDRKESEKRDIDALFDSMEEMKLELFKTEQYVGMVLSYLRAEDMSSDLMLKWYSLDDIVRRAVRKYSRMFILKKIRLDYKTCKEIVLTDEKWLLFVVEQILSNALKYTNSGEISIYSEPESTLVIEDTGIGIQEEDLPRIFEKGFTGYNGRQDRKSTGIGLYLCKNICGKLNHTISVASAPGKGTKVRLGLFREEMRHE